MQLALDHAVIQLAALIRLAAVATFEQRVELSRYCFIGLFFVARPRSAYSFFRLLQVQQTLTVRRIGKQYAHIAVIALGRVRALEKHRVGYTGLARVLDGQLHAVRIDVAADDIEFSVRLGRSSALSRACCQTDLSKQLHFSASKRRSRPGARRCAIMAASIAIVPEPQNGSRNGSRPRQRASLTIAAASVSRSGAALLLAR